MSKAEFIAKLLNERKSLLKTKTVWCPYHPCFSSN